MLLGSHLLSLDAKGRLAIPVEVRAELMKRGGGEVVITRNAPAKCLRVYPVTVWPKVQRSIQAWSRKHDMMRRLIIGSATRVQMDSAGRILISPVLRKALKLEKAVYLIGDISRLEIWNDAQFEAEMEKVQNAELSDDLADEIDPAGSLPDEDELFGMGLDAPDDEAEAEPEPESDPEAGSRPKPESGGGD